MLADEAQGNLALGPGRPVLLGGVLSPYGRDAGPGLRPYYCCSVHLISMGVGYREKGLPCGLQTVTISVRPWQKGKKGESEELVCGLPALPPFGDGC